LERESKLEELGYNWVGKSEENGTTILHFRCEDLNDDFGIGIATSNLEKVDLRGI